MHRHVVRLFVRCGDTHRTVVCSGMQDTDSMTCYGNSWIVVCLDMACDVGCHITLHYQLDGDKERERERFAVLRKTSAPGALCHWELAQQVVDH